MKILCRLGLHAWIYPNEWKNVKYVPGVHRYCEDCKQEEHINIYNEWNIDDGIR